MSTGHEKQKPAPRRRSPGYTARPHRIACEKALIRAQVREQDPRLDDAAVELEVEERFEKMLPSDPDVEKQYLRTALVSTCRDRRKTEELVEVAALRRLQPAIEFEQTLRGCDYGRPSDRLLSTTVLERNCFEVGRPEVWRNFKELMVDYRLLHWAYDWPVALGGTRHWTNIYRTLDAQLLRHDDEMVIGVNIRALRELRELLGVDDIGRWCAIDGTPVPAPREQRKAHKDHPEEEEFLNRDFEDVNFASHGSNGYIVKSWRGWRLICLMDLLTGLPIAWVLAKASRPEYEVLRQLFDLVYKYWPDWQPESVSADAHFDNETAHRLSEERYGIHLITPQAGDIDRKYDWHDHGGTPYCSGIDSQTGDEHGYMKLIQSEGFVDAKKRRELGLTPGERADHAKAAFRWVCDHEDSGTGQVCGIRERTMWDKNPRLYTYFPRRGKHKDRIALRRALMLRRNLGEMMFSRLKAKGLALGGRSTPRWVSTDSDMRWLIGGCLMGMTLARCADHIGLYDEAEAEARAKGLLEASKPTKAELKEVAARLKAGGRTIAPRKPDAAAA